MRGVGFQESLSTGSLDFHLEVTGPGPAVMQEAPNEVDRQHIPGTLTLTGPVLPHALVQVLGDPGVIATSLAP